VELEDKLDTINAELEYRRNKIQETRKLLRNEAMTINFDSLSVGDAREICKIASNELVHTRVEMDDQR
jgi:hypothetical protein